MSNRSVSVDALILCIAWTTGLSVILLACFDILSHAFASLGLAILMADCLRTVLAGQCRLRTRERDAFEMGRDSMRVVRT